MMHYLRMAGKEVKWMVLGQFESWNLQVFVFFWGAKLSLTFEIKTFIAKPTIPNIIHQPMPSIFHLQGYLPFLVSHDII